MADVVERFLRGHALAQAEREHEQILQDNKIRSQVLKHELDRMKIEDQVRARDLARQNVEMLQGQPAADLPSTTTTSQQPDLGSRSLAGVVSGLLAGNRPSGAMGTGPQIGGDQAAPGPAAAAPSFTPVATPPPGTHPVSSTTVNPVQIPGVQGEGFNIPGVSVRPQSMEDVIRRQVAGELAKPYNLGADETRFSGGTEIARGKGKAEIIPRGGTMVEAGRVVARGAKEPPVRGRPGDVLYDPDTAAVVGRVPGMSSSDQRRQDAKEQALWQRDFREYSNHIAQEQKAHAESLRVYLEKAKNAAPGDDLGEPPTYAPQTFEEWRGEHGTPAAATGGGKGRLRVTDPTSGKSFDFTTQKDADAFRADLGIQ